MGKQPCRSSFGNYKSVSRRYKYGISINAFTDDCYPGTAKFQYLAEKQEFLALSHVRNELAKNLPHDYQKILGVARALATKPKLLLLDEPLAA